jgi:hypothetical protein
MTVWDFGLLLAAVAMLAVVLWTSLQHRRMYPPGTRIRGGDGGRRRGLRWIGFIYGGGRG